MDFFYKRLEEQKSKNLWRKREEILRYAQDDNEAVIPAEARIHVTQNNNLLNFITNDYLNLAHHPKLIQSLTEGAHLYGVGSSASPLLGGYHPPHHKLERDLAKYFKFEAALVFSSGYLANLAVITSLMQKADLVLEDHSNHASLIDAVRFTNAKVLRYRNIQHLKTLCEQYPTANKWIISDGVFSMNGQIADISELVSISKLYQANLIIDDAHGIGILGKHGKGSLEVHKVNPQDISILTGTFGKALGSQGAFILGKKILIENIIQFGRPYIYSTALSPAIAHANSQSLKIMSDYQAERLRLQNLINFFQHSAKLLNIPVTQSSTPIQTLIVGDVIKAIRIVEKLLYKGILVGLIRPPTIPNNTTRLRINLTLQHILLDIQYLLESIHEILETKN